MKKEIKHWIIWVSNGYGAFYFKGNEDEAEYMRRHKAVWEGSLARKRPATKEEVKKKNPAFPSISVNENHVTKKINMKKVKCF